MLSRADDVLRERLRREAAELERQDAEQRRADAAQARADAHRKREIAELYDDAFRNFGVETPQPIDDERPGRKVLRFVDGHCNLLWGAPVDRVR